MSINRRTFLTGTGGMATTGMLAGCLGGGGGGASANVLWHQFADAEAKDFKKDFKTFKGQSDVSLETQKVNELRNQLTTAMPSGDGPGSFAWAHDWMGGFSDRGFLYDASEDIEVDVGSYTDIAQQAATYDDSLYGLPYGAETVTLMYNKELVDSPPETLDEMVSMMQEFHDPENGKYGLSYPFNPYFTSAWIQAFGGFLYDDETNELGIEREETVRGFQLLVDKLWKYSPADPGYGPQVSVFEGGNALFAINGPWQVGGFRDAGVNLGLTSLPMVEGNRPKPYTGIKMWYFTKELGNSEDALNAVTEWAEWYTTTGDVLMGNAKNQGLVPVHKDFAGPEQLDGDVKAFAETVQSGVPMPQHPDMDAVWDPVGNALTRMINDKQDPKKALQKAAGTIRERWESS